MSLGLDIPIETLQCWWDNAFDDSSAAALPFRSVLRSNERQASTLFQGGLLASVSKNSTSQSYALSRGSIDASLIQKGWRMLINLFDKCSSEIAAEAAAVPVDTQLPTGGGTDSNIHDRGNLWFTQVTPALSEYSSDLTLLLLPPTIAPPVPMTQ